MAFPLSFSQQRLWFLDQWHPNSHFYNVYGAVRLGGELHTGALEQALAALMDRHESLRTWFQTIKGEPMQIVVPELASQLQQVDLSGWKEEERERGAQHLLHQEVQTPFDLGRGSLLRVLLVRLEEQNHILLLNMHHIVSDGWSMGILVRELTTMYQAFSEGKPSPLGPLPIQYVDFACWQRQWMQGDTLQKELSYWRKKLHGAPAVLNLPTDYPRPVTQKFAGATRKRVLSERLQSDLGALCSEEDVTIFMALLTVFKILMRYYSKQEDIVVGTHVANRDRIETETVIGFFVNQLVFRTDLSGDCSFRELLVRVKETALEAYEHQALPFDILVAELRPERAMNRSPLYQVLFTFQNMAPTFTVPGLAVSPVEITADVARFDLVVKVAQENGRLVETIEYDSEIFDAKTIDMMLEQYELLIEHLAANREAKRTEMHQWLEDAEVRYRKTANRQLHQISSEKLRRIQRRELVEHDGAAK